ncbi:hypothetical protein GGX14DRAFT_633272 [Mycena pura]|uniref:Uncharacterized protein n=1 Tax=Mycena pura TaxID=153505 RepID=A0AAD6VBX0_9AGAR|nr:hypothetical protein GGX14DRAFT_633272 [Mycena pura]
MDPETNLSVLSPWDSYNPRLSGFAPPAKALDTDEFKNIQDAFIEYLPPAHADFAAVASHVPSSQPVNPLIEMGPDSLGLPLGTREAQYYCPQSSSIWSGNEIFLSNSDWPQSIQALIGVGLRFIRASVPFSLELSGMTIQRAGKTEVVPIQTTRHFAVAIIILPSTAWSAKITVEYNGRSELIFSLDNDMRRSSNLFVAYAGVDKLTVESSGDLTYLTYSVISTWEGAPSLPSAISPVIPELRDAVQTWRWELNKGEGGAPPLVLYLRDDDEDHVSVARLPRSCDTALIISHLAPLAKAYSFRLLFVQVSHVLKCRHVVDHEYKDYDYYLDHEDELTEALAMTSGKPKYEDLRCTDLDIMPAHLSPKAEEAVKKALKRNKYVGGDIEDIDPEKELECYDTGVYNDTVDLKHTRCLRMLLIIPEELV